MSLLNPFTWFARKPVGEVAAGDDPQFSRRAADSQDLPMECMFSMRIPGDVRDDGGRVARAMGFSSLAELMRFLLMREIKRYFRSEAMIFDEGPSNALHSERRAGDEV